MKETADFQKLLAYFETGKPHQQQGIFLHDPEKYEIQTRGGTCCLYLPPTRNYYAEDTWEFSFPNEAVARRPTLLVELEYWDEGFGVIAVQRLAKAVFQPEFVQPIQNVSYTRLDSRQFRRTAFQFDQGLKESKTEGIAHLRLTGIQYLRSVRVYESAPTEYWETLGRGIPETTQPVKHLNRQMEVVCSLPGASVGTAEDDMERGKALLREFLPLAKALGFTAIESYVRWNYVEPQMGTFDWSRYDAIVAELQRHNMKWFPLLIVGSAYTLPDWFAASPENIGFRCLEHGLENPIQSIWSPYHKKHVTRFLQAFGSHYEPMGCLQGVRLGPSGNYGESQYPAGGNWGFHGQPMHIHIGMWCGDPYAEEDFRRFLRERYGSVEHLNAAWQCHYKSFDEVRPILPDHCLSKRQRVDLYTWYTDSMSAWCEWWAIEARRAMPHTPIYQSAGGWGAAEIGTDYSAQTKSMLKINGGIRLTNELDSFHQCFYATRLAATAARLYKVPLGFEPAMGHTARGVAGRLFNCITNNGDHFFTYHANVFHQQAAIENWLKHYPFFDDRTEPLVEVAVYYPQTNNFLSHDTFRFLNAWGFNPFAREIRNCVEIDYLDDRLIQEGFLSRYKVLVFAWGDFLERDTLEEIDRWLRHGGVIIFPYFLNMQLATVEDDPTIFRRWNQGDVGNGRFYRYVGDDEPPSCYARYVRDVLLSLRELSEVTHVALEIQRTAQDVFVSARKDGSFWILNFGDEERLLVHPRVETTRLAPYTFTRVNLR